MQTRKLLSLSLAVLLPLINAVAAEPHTAKAHAPVLTVDIPPVTDAVAVPEPPSLALMLAGALTFVGWSILRRRSEL